MKIPTQMLIEIGYLHWTENCALTAAFLDDLVAHGVVMNSRSGATLRRVSNKIMADG